MPKAKHDFITPETGRRIKAMSFVDLSHYLWKIYSSGYSAGLLDGLRGSEPARAEAQQQTEPTNDNE